MLDDTLHEWAARYHAGKNPSVVTLNYWSRAIRLFAEALGHEPTTADLDALVLERAGQSMLSRGLSRRTVDNQMRWLFALWRFVHRAGATGCVPPKLRRNLSPRTTQRKGQRRYWRRLAAMPVMPPVVETPVMNRPGQRPEPEIVLPTFDGAAVNAAAPEAVPVKREKFSRYRKRW